MRCSAAVVRGRARACARRWPRCGRPRSPHAGTPPRTPLPPPPRGCRASAAIAVTRDDDPAEDPLAEFDITMDVEAEHSEGDISFASIEDDEMNW